MKVACPHCEKDFGIELSAVVPEDQQMIVEVTSDHELLTAKTVGTVIKETAEILRLVARDMGEIVTVFVKAIDLQPHKIAVTLWIAKGKPKQNRREVGR